MTPMRSWLVGLTLAGVFTLAAPAALACGGLFCSSPPPTTPTPPEPVDQTAERIIFEVTDTQTTAHVQIQYAGSAADFAWVVPFPTTPEVAESDITRFEAIDAATRLQVMLPLADSCPSLPVATSGGGGGGGLGGSSDGSVSG